MPAPTASRPHPTATTVSRPTPAPRRRLTGRPRRLVRAVHVVAAGGWLGLVVAMLTLGATALASPDLTPGTYRLMARVGGSVIPPLAVATLATGAVLSVFTTWGLVRHWWVVVKIVLGLAVIITAVTMTGTWLDQVMRRPSSAGAVGPRLVALSAVHLVMLAFATVISVDKPWGRTPWARRTAADPSGG